MISVNTCCNCKSFKYQIDWLPDNHSSEAPAGNRCQGRGVPNTKGPSIRQRIVAEKMQVIKKKMRHEKAGYGQTHQGTPPL
ncbi:MAG: hypothetical protein CSA85_00775 [Alphaproteobacteria bacterium]|nr:MAG: hypothetical protein CSA85_00775 [Alphaproteobacteria bacterium]